MPSEVKENIFVDKFPSQRIRVLPFVSLTLSWDTVEFSDDVCLGFRRETKHGVSVVWGVSSTETKNQKNKQMAKSRLRRLSEFLLFLHLLLYSKEKKTQNKWKEESGKNNLDLMSREWLSSMTLQDQHIPEVVFVTGLEAWNEVVSKRFCRRSHFLCESLSSKQSLHFTSFSTSNDRLVVMISYFEDERADFVQSVMNTLRSEITKTREDESESSKELRKHPKPWWFFEKTRIPWIDCKLIKHWKSWEDKIMLTSSWAAKWPESDDTFSRNNKSISERIVSVNCTSLALFSSLDDNAFVTQVLLCHEIKERKIEAVTSSSLWEPRVVYQSLSWQ